eukprot:421841-Amorphochlora_amoeboformis.AAC.1
MAEISPDTAAGLALLGQFSDPSFSSLLKWTFRNACGEDAKGKPQAMTALSGFAKFTTFARPQSASVL